MSKRFLKLFLDPGGSRLQSGNLNRMRKKGTVAKVSRGQRFPRPYQSFLYWVNSQLNSGEAVASYGTMFQYGTGFRRVNGRWDSLRRSWKGLARSLTKKDWIIKKFISRHLHKRRWIVDFSKARKNLINHNSRPKVLRDKGRKTKTVAVSATGPLLEN